MNNITAVILTKNEEEMIADCLDSLSFCSEIIIIDTNSSDMTVDIAKRYKTKIIEDTSDDFSEKRNKGLRHAKHEWIFYIDADERVSPDLKKSIEEAIQGEAAKSAYTISRLNYYFGKYEWPTTEKIIRLFRKEKLITWTGQLHESPQVKGEIGQLSGDLLHFTHRNLTGMLEKTIVWSDIEAKLRFTRNHPKMSWWRFPRVMLQAFLNSYITQKGWKAGTAGVVESMYQSFSMFTTYARLWELQQEKNH